MLLADKESSATLAASSCQPKGILFSAVDVPFSSICQLHDLNFTCIIAGSDDTSAKKKGIERKLSIPLNFQLPTYLKSWWKVECQAGKEGRILLGARGRPNPRRNGNLVNESNLVNETWLLYCTFYWQSIHTFLWIKTAIERLHFGSFLPVLACQEWIGGTSYNKINFMA